MEKKIAGADVIDAEQLDVVLTDIHERHRRVRRHLHVAEVDGRIDAVDLQQVAGMEIVHIH